MTHRTDAVPDPRAAERSEGAAPGPRRGLRDAGIVLAIVCAGCASDDALPAPAKIEQATSKVSAPADDFEFGRQLMAVDRRIDDWYDLGRQSGDGARERRELALSAIEATVAQHIDRFVAAASDPAEPTRRRVALRALAFAKDPRATKPAVAAMADGDASIQTNAAFALARLRDPDTPFEPLVHGAASPDAFVRGNSLLAIWHVLDARADAKRPLEAAGRDALLPVLEAAMFDPDDPTVRGHAAAAMGALADPRGVDPLLNLLRDKHPFVRMHTALALGKLGDRRAIRPLVSVIDETPPGTRGAVTLGIAHLLERQGISVPSGMPDDQHAWSGFIQRAIGEPARR